MSSLLTPSRRLALAALILAFVSAPLRAETITLDAVVLRPLVEAEVPARQTGVLARIEVEEGAAVEEGAVLALLDDRAAKLAVQKAQQEREQIAAKTKNDLRIQYADKALEVASAELKRSKESNEQFAKSISQSQLDVERLTVEKLELERKQAIQDIAQDQYKLQLKETALEAAQFDLELHSVKAPFAGVVALVRGRAGEWVEPGEKVLRLVGVDALRAEGFAPASAIGSINVGAQVQFLPEGAQSGTLCKGVVKFVSPETDPVTRTVRVWAEIANEDHRLRPGEQGILQIAVP